MEKLYQLHDGLVNVGFDKGHVKITNDKALKRVMQVHPEEVAGTLVERIKSDYLAMMGTALRIEDHSFVVEIWGHVYFEYFLLKYRRLFRIILPFGLYSRFRRSCEVIDCGERDKDPNRRVWDILARYWRRVPRWLQRRNLLRFAGG